MPSELPKHLDPHEFERLALSAPFYHDAFDAPLLVAIRLTGSTRPFLEALRNRAEALADHPIRAVPTVLPEIVRDSDLDIAQKIFLFSHLVLAAGDDQRPDAVAKAPRGESPLVDVVRAAPRAALAPLLRWFDVAPRSAPVAAALVDMVAEAEPAAVLEAIVDVEDRVPLDLLARVCGAHPHETVVFVRRCMKGEFRRSTIGVSPGLLECAALMLTAIDENESVRAEVLELASALASNPRGGRSRLPALDTLLCFGDWRSPELWAWIESIPEHEREPLVLSLSDMVPEWPGALEVLERWLRATADPTHLGRLAVAFALTASKPWQHLPPEDVQTRLVQNIAEAWRRGAEAPWVARAINDVLADRTDEEMAWLGVEELAVSFIASDAAARQALLVGFAAHPAGGAWAGRLLDALCEAAAAGEREEWLTSLADLAPNPWLVAVRDRLAQGLGQG